MSQTLVNFYDTLKSKEKSQYYNPNPLAPQHPFRLIAVAASGSGKTNVILNVVQKCACFNEIYLVSSNSDEPLYNDLKRKLGKKFVVIEDINDLPTLKSSMNLIVKKVKKPKPEKEFSAISGVFIRRKGEGKKLQKEEETESEFDTESDTGESQGESETDESGSESEHSNKKGKDFQKLIIFEDLILQSNAIDKKIANYFIRGRHDNFSCIVTSQSWYNTPKPVRLNCNYVVLLRMSSQKEITNIIKDLGLDVSKEQLVSIFNYATGGTSFGNFLMIDNCTRNPQLKFRKNFDEGIITKQV